MKRYIALFFAATITTGVMAQEGKKVPPPAVVRAAFEKSYPGLSGAKWYKEEGATKTCARVHCVIYGMCK